MSSPSVDILFDILPSTSGPSQEALFNNIALQLCDPQSKLRSHSQFGTLAQVSELTLLDEAATGPEPKQAEVVKADPELRVKVKDYRLCLDIKQCSKQSLF